MKNKKDWLRVLIYIFFAFALAWIPWYITIEKHGLEYFNKLETAFMVIPLMFPPAIAHIITRAVTKEGWNGMRLHLCVKGNIKYYVFSLIYVFVYWALGAVLLAALNADKFSFQRITDNVEAETLPIMIMSIIPSALLRCWIIFGEEFGWRAYVYPKLVKLIKNPALVGIIGGIIWGMWHMPLTNAGQNFGTEYWGYPWMGNVIMCVDCVAMGMVMMWVTKKTGSIYPACIIHAINNTGGAIIGNIILLGLEDPDKISDSTSGRLITLVPGLVIAIVCAVLMMKDAKREKHPEPAPVEEIKAA